MAEQPAKTTRWNPAANAVLFCALFAVWEILDRVSKSYFDSTMTLGQTISGPVPGLFTFTLVHNTGGAWGMLSSATFFLGVFSLVVSIAIAVFALRYNTGATWLETAALALVVAGGFGNAVDRFALGYVVDFINFSFVDFPVFNIADIGVTVGMAVFFVALLVRTLKESKAKPTPKAVVDASDTLDISPMSLRREESAGESNAEVVGILTDGGIMRIEESGSAEGGR